MITSVQTKILIMAKPLSHFSRDTNLAVVVQLQTGWSQDQGPHHVGPDLGSSLFASSTTPFFFGPKID